MEKQACLIYAGGKGYMDPVDVEKVGEFEQAFYAALENDKGVLKSIADSGEMSDADKEKIDRISKSVSEQFSS